MESNSKIFEKKIHQLVENDDLEQFKDFCNKNGLNLRELLKFKFNYFPASLLLIAVSYHATSIVEHLLKLGFSVDLSVEEEKNPLYCANDLFYVGYSCDPDEAYGIRSAFIHLAELLIEAIKKRGDQIGSVVASREKLFVSFSDTRMMVLLLKNGACLSDDVNYSSSIVFLLYKERCFPACENDQTKDYRSFGLSGVSELLSLVLQRITKDHLRDNLKKIVNHAFGNHHALSRKIQMERWKNFEELIPMIVDNLCSEDANRIVQDSWVFLCSVYYQIVLSITPYGISILRDWLKDQSRYWPDSQTISRVFSEYEKLGGSEELICYKHKDENVFLDRIYSVTSLDKHRHKKFFSRINEHLTNFIKNGIKPNTLMYQALKVLIRERSASIFRCGTIIRDEQMDILDKLEVLIIGKKTEFLDSSESFCNSKDFLYRVDPFSVDIDKIKDEIKCAISCYNLTDKNFKISDYIPCDIGQLLASYSMVFINFMQLISFYSKFKKHLSSSTPRVVEPFESEVGTVIEDLTQEEFNSVEFGVNPKR